MNPVLNEGITQRIFTKETDNSSSSAFKKIAFGYRSVEEYSLKDSQVRKSYYKYLCARCLQGVSLASAVLSTGTIFYTMYHQDVDFLKPLTRFAIVVASSVVCMIAVSVEKKHYNSYLKLAEKHIFPAYADVVDMLRNSGNYKIMLHFFITGYLYDITKSHIKKTIEKNYSACSEKQINTKDLENIKNSYIEAFTSLVQQTISKCSIINLLDSLTPDRSRIFIKDFILHGGFLKPKSKEIIKSMAIGLEKPSEYPFLPTSIIQFFRKWIEKIPDIEFQNKYTFKIKKVLITVVDREVAIQHKKLEKTLKTINKIPCDFSNEAKTIKKPITSDSCNVSNTNAIYDDTKKEYEKKKDALIALNFICNNLKNNNVSYKKWCTMQKKIHKNFSNEELYNLLKELNFSHKFIKDLQALITTYSPLKNHETLNSHAIDIRVTKMESPKTLFDIEIIAKNISENITTTDIPAENIKLYLLQKNFLELNLTQSSSTDNDSVSLNKTDKDYFSKMQIKPSIAMPIEKIEDEQKDNLLNFHSGKEHIIEKLSANINNHLIRACLQKIENTFDINNKDNQKFSTSLTHLDGELSYPIYHISLGRKNTGKTATLFFTVKDNVVHIIAAGKHINTDTYSIQWSLPSINFTKAICISSNTEILNKY